MKKSGQRANSLFGILALGLGVLAGQARAQANVNATDSGTINYLGPFTGTVVVWAFENGHSGN